MSYYLEREERELIEVVNRGIRRRGRKVVERDGREEEEGKEGGRKGRGVVQQR